MTYIKLTMMKRTIFIYAYKKEGEKKDRENNA
jgi:hypothetical protein